VKFFFKYLEIFLSVAGLVVILIIPQIVHPENWSAWKVGAFTAIIVGFLHGMIFFGVRHRQRKVRSEAIKEIQSMLIDRVRNQLAVIRLSTESKEPLDAKTFDQCQNAIDELSDCLRYVSEESLDRWKSKYPNAG
jgi:hypothetical protein